MEAERVYKGHVVVLPYHTQGHMNPMVQFSKRLAAKGIKVTVATTLSNAKTLQALSSSIIFESIYDDCSDGGTAGLGGFKAFLDRFEAIGSGNLSELIKKHLNSEYPVKCLFFDANINWASNVATSLGLSGAAFFTQSCAAIATYYPMHCDLSGKPLSVPAFPMLGLPEVAIPNLPSLGSDGGRYPPIIRHILSQFDNIEKAKWVLFNSFDKLEEEVIKWMSELWCIRTVGPTVPSAYIDKQVEGDNDYIFNVHKPKTDACMEWLNTKKTCSVAYISFGSAASLSQEQIVEIANALKFNTTNFLWVVRPSEESKLPPNFIEETSGKGLVVTWCSQLQVLAHDAVGCFVSHCGWNSTVEAISFGVPVVSMPQFLDQMTNAHFAEQVWGVGITPKTNEKGLTLRDEIHRCIQEVLHGDRGHEIRKNAVRWKQLAKEALDIGGTSDKNIDDIVAEIESIY